MFPEYEDFFSSGKFSTHIPVNIPSKVSVFASNRYCNVAVTDSHLTVWYKLNSIYNLPTEGCDDHFSSDVSAPPHRARPRRNTLSWLHVQVAGGLLVPFMTAVSPFKSVAFARIWGWTYCVGCAQSSCSRVTISPRVRLSNPAAYTGAVPPRVLLGS